MTDAEEAISKHTVAFARILIAHPKVPPIPLVHTITAPTAMQNLLPYLPRELGSRLYGCLWQVSAAIAAIFAAPAKPGILAARPAFQAAGCLHCTTSMCLQAAIFQTRR